MIYFKPASILRQALRKPDSFELTRKNTSRFMYIVPIAWLYVTIMMAVAEATNTNGTVLGGIITFLLYGLLPMSIVVYVMGAPTRKRAIREKERAELADAQAALNRSPDAGTETAADPVTPIRKEP